MSIERTAAPLVPWAELPAVPAEYNVQYIVGSTAGSPCAAHSAVHTAVHSAAHSAVHSAVDSGQHAAHSAVHSGKHNGQSLRNPIMGSKAGSPREVKSIAPPLRKDKSKPDRSHSMAYAVGTKGTSVQYARGLCSKKTSAGQTQTVHSSGRGTCLRHG